MDYVHFTFCLYTTWDNLISISKDSTIDLITTKMSNNNRLNYYETKNIKYYNIYERKLNAVQYLLYMATNV